MPRNGLHRSEQAARRFATHGSLRPSLSGCVALVLDAAVWYAALLFDERTLVAGALAGALALAVALLIAVLQAVCVARVDRRDIGRSTGPRNVMLRDGQRSKGDSHVGSARLGRWLRSQLRFQLWPHGVTVMRQYEQRDQDGEAIARFAGELPQARGLFCSAREAWRWKDPFGLFVVRVVLRSDAEHAMLANPEPAAGAKAAGLGPHPRDRTQGESTPLVRDYVAGDPPKLIAWRQSAHRGTLMTRETSRESKPTIVIVLDARTPGVTQAQVESEVMQALMLIRGVSGRERDIVVTDGVRSAATAHERIRLLASMCAIAGTAAEALAPEIRRLAQGIQGPATVVLLAAANEGALSSALREELPPGSLRIQTVDGAAGDERNPPLRHIALSSSPDAIYLGQAHGQAQPGRNAAMNAAAAQRPRSSRLHRNDLVTALALLAFFELAVHGCAVLVAPDGFWVWFARIAFAMIAAGHALPERSDVRELARAAIASLAIVLAAAAMVLVRVRSITGIWLFDAAAYTRSASGMPSAPNDSFWQRAWQLLESCFQQGFDALIEQLPPVSVRPSSDLVLIVVVAVAALIARWLLVYRTLAPVFALMPLAALAADAILLGHKSPAWFMTLATVAFMLSLWSRKPAWSAAYESAESARPEDAAESEQPGHADPIALPTLSSVLVAALTMALTGSAMNLAYAVPLSIGDSTGLLSANTINPMVDLKRSLAQGSSATVLEYASEHPRYLRMSTLDDFNGDTWRYDRELARNGDFYGSPLLSAGEGQGGRSRTWWFDDPLAVYLNLQYLGLGSATTSLYGDGGDYSTISGNSGSATPSPFMARADIRIESLSSRFLPVAGDPVNFTGVDSSWLVDDQGIVYNPARPTTRNMRYSVLGAYLEPISSDSGFDQISRVEALRESMIAEQPGTSMSWRERSASRRAAASDAAGSGTSIDGNWLLMPLSIRAGGDVVDASGAVVGEVGESSGTLADAGGKSTELRNIVFNDALNQRLGFSTRDEPYGLAFENAEMLTLAMLVDASAAPAQGWEGGDAGAAGDDGLAAWQRNPGSTLADMFRRHDLGAAGVITSGAETNDRTTIPRSAMQRIAASEQRIQQQYTQLPVQLPARVRAIVDAARAAGTPAAGNDADSQIAAMRYLVDYFADARNRFAYSLDAPDGGGRNNMQVIDDFLETRSGFCIHYASALAVLGRAMGVPTRMVLGYRAGDETSERNGSYAVAAKQLHSWVEAYIDGVGWVPFDVTPASEDQSSVATGISSASSNASATAAPSQSTPSSASTSRENAPSPTSGDSAAADAKPAQGADNGIFAMLLGMSRWVRIVLWLALGMLLAAAAACAPAALRAKRRRRRMRTIGSASQLVHDRGKAAQAWILAWDELQDTAWDAGVRWNQNRTDRDIAAAIIQWLGQRVEQRSESSQSGGLADDVERLADAALAAAFSPDGGAPVGDLQERLEALIETLLQARRKSSRKGWLAAKLLPSSLLRRSRNDARSIA
jgi:hypothetical protein